jgi:hypothetical protein
MRAFSTDVVLAPVAVQLALPQPAHDLDRLDEHLGTVVIDRPVIAEDVLVEVLAGPDAEEESAVEEVGGRRRGLRDDRRMGPDHRTGHAGADLQRGGLTRNAAEDSPHERRLALGIDPRVIVIADKGELEPRVLRLRGLSHEVRGTMFFAAEGITEASHGGARLHDRCRGEPPVHPRA